MKKTRAILFVLAVFLVMTGCSRSNVDLDESDVEYNEEYSEEDTKVEESEQEQEKYYVNLITATPFSDGAAWVIYEDPFYGTEGTVGILNTKGEIISNDSLYSWGKMGSEFSEGYAYINEIYGESGYAIVDKEGNVTAKSDENSTCEIIAGGDGIYLVHQEIKDFSSNEDRYGFIDVNGNWIKEPTTEHPFTHGTSALGGQIIPTISYRGNHIFTSENRGYEFVVYNADLDQTICTMEQVSYCSDFDENVGIVADEEKVYSVSTNGEVSTLFEWNSYFDVLKYSEGIVFWESHEKGCGMLFDTKGNMMADLSNYTILNSNVTTEMNFYQCIGGALAACLRGADGQEYVTLLDEKGELIMEPVLVSGGAANYRREPYGLYSKDGIFVRGDEQNFILCSDGTIIETESTFYGMEIKEIIYNDGYAWQIDPFENTANFVDRKGVSLDTYVWK